MAHTIYSLHMIYLFFFCQKGKFPLQRGFSLSTSLVYPQNNNTLCADISRINWNVFRVLNFSFQLLLL